MDTYTVKEVAKMMNTSEETVRRWIRSGKLKANMDSRKKGSVITDAMLNRVTENWKQGKRTHIFLDEFHVVFENEYC